MKKIIILMFSILLVATGCSCENKKEVITDAGVVAYYDHQNGQWYDGIFDYLLDKEVLAWCDYPKYEETEEKPAV